MLKGRCLDLKLVYSALDQICPPRTGGVDVDIAPAMFNNVLVEALPGTVQRFQDMAQIMERLFSTCAAKEILTWHTTDQMLSHDG